MKAYCKGCGEITRHRSVDNGERCVVCGKAAGWYRLGAVLRRKVVDAFGFEVKRDAN